MGALLRSAAGSSSAEECEAASELIFFRRSASENRRDALRDALSWHAALTAVRVRARVRARATLTLTTLTATLSRHAALTAVHVPLHDGRASLTASCAWASCVPRAYPPIDDTPAAAAGG